MKYLGKTSSNLECYRIDGKDIALNKWNGEIWHDCFRVDKYLQFDKKHKESYIIEPIYNLEELSDHQYSFEMIDLKIKEVC